MTKVFELLQCLKYPNGHEKFCLSETGELSVQTLSVMTPRESW